MNEEMIWIAGHLGVEDIPDEVAEVVERQFYTGGERRGGVAREEVAVRVGDLLSILSVSNTVARSSTDDVTDTAVVTSEVWEPTNAYLVARSSVEAEYYGLQVEIACANLPLEIQILRHHELDGLPAETPKGRKSEREALVRFGAVKSALKGDLDEEREVAFISDNVWAMTAIPKARDTFERVSRAIGGYWDVPEIIDVYMDRVLLVRPAIEIGPASQTPGDGRIVFTVAAWTPAEEVDAMFKAIQRHLVGRRPRALSLRNLEMAGFVLPRLREAWYRLITAQVYDTLPVGRPMWRILKAEWNDEHPDASYEQASVFRRDVLRTLEQVAPHTQDKGGE